MNIILKAARPRRPVSLFERNIVHQFLSNSTLSQIRIPRHNLKKGLSKEIIGNENGGKASTFRRRGQDLNSSFDNVNHIRSLLNKTPKGIPHATEEEALAQYLSIVTTITISESINLLKVLELSPYPTLVLVPDEVVNVQFPGATKNEGICDVMVLSNGTIVGWGIDEKQLLEEFVPMIKDSIQEKYKYESEEMDWIELETKNDIKYDNDEHTNNKVQSYMEGEIMIIQGKSKNKKLLDKTAFAVGLSRSTRLAVLESALEEHILLTRADSENLSKGKKLLTTESDVLKLTGRLFLLRGKLNLYSELIETPDLYWAEPSLEKIYNSISRTLDISPRISILNRKLDYATEEQRALLSVLNEKKGTRLEWVIIILIMVEVCFETFHFYERYVEKHDDDH